MIDLAEDGTLVTGHVVLVGGTYTLMGDLLRKQYSDGAESEEHVTIVGDTWNRSLEAISPEAAEALPGLTIPYRRVEPARSDAAPIVGVWEPEVEVSEFPFRERYTDDGHFLLRHSLGANSGSWEFVDGVLAINASNSKARYAVTRSENLLTLTPIPPDSEGPRTFVSSDRWYAFFPMTDAERAKILEKMGGLQGAK